MILNKYIEKLFNNDVYLPNDIVKLIIKYLH